MKATLGPDPRYFLWSLAAGLLLALIYDILRFSRKIIKTSDIIINIEDILFIIFTGLIASVLAYLVNNGFFRIYSLFSIILAFVLYRIIVRSKVVDLFISIYHLIHKTMVAVFKIFLIPLKFILRLIRKPLFVVIGGTARRFKVINREKCEKKT